VPQTQTSFTSGPLKSRDGKRLYGRWHTPSGVPRGGALVLHGYADHGGRYDEVSRHLVGLGLAAYALDYRGHGRADGARGHCEHFSEFLDDLDAGLGEMRRAVPRGPLLIVAHSHGGLVSLRALTDRHRAPRVDGVVLSSPFLGIALPVHPMKRIAGQVASRVYPALALPNEIRTTDLTHDAERLRWTEADGLRHGVVTARWFTEAVRAQAYVHRNAGRLAVPSLWLVAGADRLVSVDATRRVFGRAGGEKDLHVYDGLFHELFNETTRAQVFEHVEAWILRRFLAS
jgi:alpha-beta hydrolase superfamily lysophospholipase